MLAARDRNRLQARMHAESAEQGAHVVADRLEAEMELPGYLFGGPAELEQPQDLGLARRQMRVKQRLGFVLDVHQLAEDPDDAVPLEDADGADLDGHSLVMFVEQESGGRSVPVAFEPSG